MIGHKILSYKKEEFLNKKEKHKNNKIFEKQFAMLYKNNYIPLCRYAYYITSKEILAEEIVQDVFTNLWNKRKKLSMETNPKSYLYISVRNLAYSRIKKMNNQNETYEIPEMVEDTNTTFNESFFLKQLKLAIQNLPEKCREIYCLKYYEGLTYKEISNYLNISEKTVEVQVYNALQKLRIILRPFQQEFYNND